VEDRWAPDSPRNLCGHPQERTL